MKPATTKLLSWSTCSGDPAGPFLTQFSRSPVNASIEGIAKRKNLSNLPGTCKDACRLERLSITHPAQNFLRNPLPPTLLPPPPQPEEPASRRSHCLAGRLGSEAALVSLLTKSIMKQLRPNLHENCSGASSLHCPEPGAVARKFHEEDVGRTSVRVAIQGGVTLTCNHQVVVLVHLQWGSSGQRQHRRHGEKKKPLKTHLEPAKMPAAWNGCQLHIQLRTFC